jgi:predicted O-methyltransferase YrrM
MPPGFGFHGLRGRLVRAALGLRGATVVRMAGADAARDLKVVAETRVRTPLLMQDAAALQILACVRACRHLGGAMAEAGVYAGGSARLICEAKGDVPLHLFDVFETLQAPASATEGSAAREVREHFGATHATRASVELVLRGYPAVHIHEGVLPESATAVGHESFSFVHLDLDLARATREALEFFHPRLLPGGIIVGDDYESVAVRSAFTDYLRARRDTLIELPWSQVVVVKGG